MDAILYFFRDTISGTYYFIYCFVCLLLMFSIIGYLFKQKYAKVEVKLNTTQPKTVEKVNEAQNQVSKNEQTIQKKEVIQQKVTRMTPTTTPQKTNINIQPQVINVNPKVINQNLNQSQTKVVSNQLQEATHLKKIEIANIK